MISLPDDLRALLEEKLAEADQLAADVRTILRTSPAVVAAGRIAVTPSAPTETTDEEIEDFRRRSCVSKKSYSTPERAGSAAQTALALRNEKLRIYPCTICRGYHLTKVPLDVAAGRLPR
ncbi:MAG: hypothetical protein EPN98_21745 [Phenylobacterium sp.]|uniref:hypothetical protein n=1 Tax=Phenylobacterium sp. TaxID=1871053 RepID=UPI0011FA6C40|nr:hypothetical protein [Phenylobacterium sp.]TAL29068.1 MAG: hypothetical protein EPN98_21745 [Phenylobacterium sp.]